MNSKNSLMWNLSDYSRTRTHSVDYSRHLSGTARPKPPMDKRPSKSFSDTDAIGLLSRSSYHKVAKKVAGVEGALQTKVYNRDNSFHRKYGSKNGKLETYTFPPTPMRRWVNSPVNSALGFGISVDDDTQSFCDSISSIACSNFASTEEDEHRKSKDDFPDKFAKFDAIETWLQRLSRPVL